MLVFHTIQVQVEGHHEEELLYRRRAGKADEQHAHPRRSVRRSDAQIYATRNCIISYFYEYSINNCKKDK